MSNQQLATKLYEIGVIKLGQFTLKSGKTSPIYLDLRKIISFPELMRDIAERLWEQVKSCQFELICGVPYTALPVATCISLEHNLPMIMRRKEKKDYGTKQMIEGVYQAGQTCLIIEDVITTGGSIMETAEDIKTAGLTIHDVAIFIDREQGGKEALEKHFRVHSVFTLTQLLADLVKTGILPRTEMDIVQHILAEKAQ